MQNGKRSFVNMKKIIIFLFLAVIYVSLQNSSYALGRPIIYAQPQVDYQLPYPGLLPDNPLYKIKTLRDHIIEFLVTDPVRKAEFYLLQSDKRVNAAYYLSQEKPVNEQLIVDTISKSQNYFGQAIEQMNIAKKQGILVEDLRQKLFRSNIKYQQVLMTIAPNGSDLEKKLQKEESRIFAFEKMVSVIRPSQ